MKNRYLYFGFLLDIWNESHSEAVIQIIYEASNAALSETRLGSKLPMIQNQMHVAALVKA